MREINRKEFEAEGAYLPGINNNDLHLGLMLGVFVP